MIRAPKILWGEGLFLRPQHFQQQDAYHEWRQADIARALHPYAWGLRSMELDTGALASGLLRLKSLQLIFPDGDLYAAPQDDELPEPVSLSSLPATVSETMVHLALAPMRPDATNFGKQEDSARAATRYAQHEESTADWFTGAVEVQLSTLRRQARLMLEGEPHAHLVSLPLLRLRRQAGGAFEADTRFVPPLMALSASPALCETLRQLLDVLQAKVDALYGMHREPSRHVIEFRSGDVASFWLLHTCSAAFAALSHLARHPLLHPERLFERMLELAGALMTFSKSYRLTDLPTYSHQLPTECFAQLERIVRDLLETVISTRCFSIALALERSAYYQGRLDSHKIDGLTRFYLGVQAGLPQTDLIDAIPQRLKIGAPDDVEKLVLSAMPGVRLTHVPQVPSAIPVRPGVLYFALDPRSALYERMLQAQAITLYVPTGLPELQLELFALSGEH